MLNRGYIYKCAVMVTSVIMLLAIKPLMRFYGVKLAQSEDELISIFKFRYKIYQMQSGAKCMEKYCHEGKIFDKYDNDKNTLNIYAVNKKDNTLIGAMRIIFFDDSEFYQEKLETYNLSKEFVKTNKPCGEFGFLLINKKYRGGLLILTLMCSIFFYLRDRKIYTRYIFGYSMPGIFKLYESVGCYSYTKKLINDEDGIAIPFVFAPYVNNLFRSDYVGLPSGSELLIRLYTLKTITSKISQSKIDWLKCANGSLLNKVSLHPVDMKSAPISNIFGMSANLDFILSHLDPKQCILITVENDNLIATVGSNDNCMYVILSGAVEVWLNGHIISELRPGEIIGCEEAIINTRERLFSYKSKSVVEMLLIPRRAIFKSSKKYREKLIVSLSQEILTQNYTKLYMQSIIEGKIIQEPRLIESVTALSVLSSFLNIAHDHKSTDLVTADDINISKYLINRASSDKKATSINNVIIKTISILPRIISKIIPDRIAGKNYSRLIFLRKVYLKNKIDILIENGYEQFIFLGAGYDPRSLILSKSQPALTYFEVDTGMTVKNKLKYMIDFPDHNFKVNNQINNGLVTRVNGNMVIIDCDLSRSNDFRNLLLAAGYNQSKKSCFIAEGLTMYLDESENLALLKNLNRMIGHNESLVILSFMKSPSYSYLSKLVQTRSNELYRFCLSDDKVNLFVSQAELEVVEEIPIEKMYDTYKTQLKFTKIDTTQIQDREDYYILMKSK